MRWIKPVVNAGQSNSRRSMRTCLQSVTKTAHSPNTSSAPTASFPRRSFPVVSAALHSCSWMGACRATRGPHPALTWDCCTLRLLLLLLLNRVDSSSRWPSKHHTTSLPRSGASSSSLVSPGHSHAAAGRETSPSSLPVLKKRLPLSDWCRWAPQKCARNRFCTSISIPPCRFPFAPYLLSTAPSGL